MKTRNSEPGASRDIQKSKSRAFKSVLLLIEGAPSKSQAEFLDEAILVYGERLRHHLPEVLYPKGINGSAFSMASRRRRAGSRKAVPSFIVQTPPSPVKTCPAPRC